MEAYAGRGCVRPYYHITIVLSIRYICSCPIRILVDAVVACVPAIWSRRHEAAMSRRVDWVFLSRPALARD